MPTVPRRCQSSNSIAVSKKRSMVTIYVRMMEGKRQPPLVLEFPPQVITIRCSKFAVVAFTILEQRQHVFRIASCLRKARKSFFGSAAIAPVVDKFKSHVDSSVKKGRVTIATPWHVFTSTRNAEPLSFYQAPVVAGRTKRKHVRRNTRQKRDTGL